MEEISVIGIDPAESVFQLEAQSPDGAVVWKKRLRHAAFMRFMEKQAPRCLGMGMRAEDRCTRDADCAVAQGRALRRASDDADMSRCHDDARHVHDNCRIIRYCIFR